VQKRVGQVWKNYTATIERGIGVKIGVQAARKSVRLAFENARS
jgi:hypothetical protein